MCTIVRQAKTYSCGAASLMSVLQYFKKYDGREENLYRKLGTSPETGTHPNKIVQVAREHGLQAQLHQGLSVRDLRRAVKKARP